MLYVNYILMKNKKKKGTFFHNIKSSRNKCPIEKKDIFAKRKQKELSF